MHHGTYRKILVVKPSSFGDIIHSLPFLYSLRKRHPDAEIHWVVARGLEGLLEDHPMISRTWIVEMSAWKKPSRIPETIAELRSLFRSLKQEGYDLAIDLQGLLRSAVITLFSGAPVRAGFSDARELSPLLYNLKVPGGRNLHAVDRYLKLASLVSADTEVSHSADKVRFPLPELKSIDLPAETYYIVVPGARWENKRWPVEYFIDVINSLPYKAVITGTKEDIGLAERIVSETGDRSINMTGKTGIKELISYVKGASFLLSNDTGTMHLGAALSVPVFAVFGPTDDALTGPYGEKKKVFRAELECSPCFKRSCRTTECMNELYPDPVIDAIKEEIAK